MISHVALLEPNVLNTHFPAWLHQQPEDNVLHLAGCSSLFRKTAFQRGLVSLCAASLREAPFPDPYLSLPPQLTLTQAFLHHLEESLPLDESAAALHTRIQDIGFQ